ncbi:MAG: diguanylate cyclase [Gammaproteobacteria bacterium]|nr:diguanylate cyclase [Gammaproteobacteria bacterium]MDH3858338.1 diguanylate cyclase [Gammaproteobacteria bacterium]
MPTIDVLAVAQAQQAPTSEFSSLTREELEVELGKLRRRESLFDATEQAAKIGHYEWNYQLDRLESCSKEYANLYGMSIEEALAHQDSWEKTVQQIHPDDEEHYRHSWETLRDKKILDARYRIVLDNGAIKHIREFAVIVTDDDGNEHGSFGIVQDISDQVRYERDLEYRDELSSQTEAITDIGHFIYDEDKERYVYISDGCARIFGTTAEAYQEKMRSVEDDLADIVSEDRQRVADEYRHYIETGQDCALEFRIKRADGSIRWVRELTRAKQFSNGGVQQTLGVIQDITERVAREQELLYKDALANQAEAITEIGHFIYDEIKQKYLFVSPGLARIYGMDGEQIVTRLVPTEGASEIIHADDLARVQKAYDKFLSEGGEWQVEFRLKRGDGELRWVREVGRAYLMTHGIPEQSIGVLQDITRQKQSEQEIISARDSLEQQVVERTRELANTVKQLQVEIEEREKIAAELDFLANHDALTGLPSLRLCKDRLDQSLAEARRNRQTSAVMFVDLDGFKEINDQYGHDFGDMVLKTTAERIKSEIRETDTVARIGGDEFVIILSSLPETAIAERIAATVIEQVAKPLKIKDVEVTITASIGISLYPEHGTTAEKLIRAADKAMYEIKRKGKNSFGFVGSVSL